MGNALFKFGAVIGIAVALLGCWLINLDDGDSRRRMIEIAVAGLGVLGAIVGIVAGYEQSKASDRALSETREQLAAASGRIEGERSARLELERALAPRCIEQGESPKALLPFTGMNVVLLATPDAEPTATAAAIEFLLRAAGWSVTRGIAQPGALMGTGLLIETKIKGLAQAGDRSRDAADELLSQLEMRSNVSGTHLDWVTDETIPSNTLKITVGPVPQKFFQDKALDQLIERMEPEAREAMKEMRQRFKDADAKREGLRQKGQ